MVELKSFFHALLAAGFALAVFVHAQDQSGFISIDCGIPATSGYNDETTGIKYVSDATFIGTGISKSISPEFKTNSIERQFHSLRSFPDSAKNCYTLNPAQGKDSKYLIRARFMYGNYDGKGNVPEFDLYVGVYHWDTIKLDNVSSTITTEIIHVSSTDHIYVCLVNTGLGAPFISSLELRLLRNSTYETQSQSEQLLLLRRYDFGSTTNRSVRYKDDIYDRIWMPKNFLGWKTWSTSLPIDAINPNNYQPAPAVMSTAVTSEDVSLNLSIFWMPPDPITKYYVFFHFAEVELLVNQTREFNVSQNGKLFMGNIVPDYLYTTTIYNSKPVSKPLSGEPIQYDFYQTERSTLPPILNAIEMYIVKESSQSETDQNDVDAIMNIKSKYGVKRNWQGDPCAPKSYWWDGLNCTSVANDPPRITALHLSSSGLSGEISPYFANLTSIQYLDLSNNSLSGTVPEFLSQLSSLTVLNLTRNKLTGSLPAKLMERLNNGSLTLSADENPNICLLESCKQKKKNKFVVPVVVASVAAFSAVLIALAILCGLKRRKKQVVGKVECESETINDSFVSKNRQFTYSDVERITKNFETVLGKGGFGSVYHGYLDDNTQVAVKMLSSSSDQGYKEFHAEVKLLMRVHHRNLATLVGYCIEGTNMGLIYEYMNNGTLEQHLSSRNEYILSWKDRLQIAVDSAQGLEYLHNGCKPPIVHRDIKASNILLNEKLQAKIADFGLSRIFSIEGETHISTMVAGTPGYLDPEYYASNWLNEKSDVYSFGVVLLKIITGRPAISTSMENAHISQWVSSMLAEGDIGSIIDSRLGENFNNNSAWKAVELALACASHTSSNRPAMTEVVTELKQCLAVEIAREGEQHHENPRRTVTINLGSEFSPVAR